jgi:hypothetical protein
VPESARRECAIKRFLFLLAFLGLSSFVHAQGTLTINQNVVGSLGTLTIGQSTQTNLGTITVSTTPALTNGGTYTFIQQTSCNANTFTGTCAYVSNVTAHSLLIAGCVMGGGWSSVNNLTISDNNSNSWVPIARIVNANGGGSAGVGLFYALNANFGATTITCKDSGSGAAFVQNSILEYGSSGSGAFDVFSSSSPFPSKTNPTSTAMTTTLANEFVVAYAAIMGGTASGPSGTIRVNYVNNEYVAVEDAVAATPGSYTSTLTQATPAEWVMIQAGFK